MLRFFDLRILTRIEHTYVKKRSTGKQPCVCGGGGGKGDDTKTIKSVGSVLGTPEMNMC